MKKTIRTILSSLALIALISCGGHIATDSGDSSVISDSGDTSISSEVDTSSDDVLSSSSDVVGSDSSSSSTSSIEVTYHVRFVNYDDELLYETDVLEGNKAEYVGDTPTKPEDKEFTYEFEKWDKDLSSITSDLTTKALYKQKDKIKYGPIIWFLLD